MQKLTQNEHSTVSFCFVDRNRTSIHQKRMHTSDLPSSTKLNVHKAAGGAAVVSYCLVGRNIIRIHQKRMYFSYLPRSITNSQKAAHCIVS
jgi:hypothetical protein